MFVLDRAGGADTEMFSTFFFSFIGCDSDGGMRYCLVVAAWTRSPGPRGQESRREGRRTGAGMDVGQGDVACRSSWGFSARFKKNNNTPAVMETRLQSLKKKNTKTPPTVSWLKKVVCDSGWEMCQVGVAANSCATCYSVFGKILLQLAAPQKEKTCWLFVFVYLQPHYLKKKLIKITFK